MAEFSHHPCLRPPLRGGGLEFGMKFGVRKRIVGLPDDEEIMTLAFFVLTQYRRVKDRRTGGRTHCSRKHLR